jgi:hypothetical protein
MEGGHRLWNEEFVEPYAPGPNGWGRKYRKNIPALVETICGLPLAKGAAKLYGFANFDWIPSPKEEEVCPKRMKQGETDVLRVLKLCRPRVIAGMTRQSHARLLGCLLPPPALFGNGISGTPATHASRAQDGLKRKQKSSCS